MTFIQRPNAEIEQSQVEGEQDRWDQAKILWNSFPNELVGGQHCNAAQHQYYLRQSYPGENFCLDLRKEVFMRTGYRGRIIHGWDHQEEF